MQKSFTYKEALHKSAVYCSRSEKCKFDIQKKLYDWNIEEKFFDDILNYLEKENYINEERYAEYFSKDKFRFNKWGKVKITAELRRKNISENNIQKGLLEIDDKEYQKTLKYLIEKKSKSIKATSLYSKNKKLMAFASSKGYEQNLILSILNNSTQT